MHTQAPQRLRVDFHDTRGRTTNTALEGTSSSVCSAAPSRSRGSINNGSVTLPVATRRSSQSGSKGLEAYLARTRRCSQGTSQGTSVTGLDRSAHSRDSQDGRNHRRRPINHQRRPRRQDDSDSVSLSDRSRCSLDESRLMDNRLRRRAGGVSPRKTTTNGLGNASDGLDSGGSSHSRISQGSVRSQYETSSSNNYNRPSTRTVRGGRRPFPSSASSSVSSNSTREKQQSSIVPEEYRRSMSLHSRVPSTMTTATATPPAAQIEIAPGQTARLRGSKETYFAVKHDFVISTCCLECQTDLCCVADASYVLCPLCRVVGPLEGGADDGQGGIGLGITRDILQQWQTEIKESKFRY